MWYTNFFTYAEIKKLGVEMVESIKNDLTITIENKVMNKTFKPTIIKLFSFNERFMFVPRFYPQTSKQSFRNIEPDMKWTPTFITMNQEVIFDYLNEFYKTPNGCVLNLRTGEGKSYIARALARRWAQSVLIVTHNEDSCIMWTKLWDEILPGEVGMWSGKIKCKKRIVVSIINSVVKNPKKWFDDFDFVIFDEITEYTSPTRRSIFELATAPRLMGLSATPAQHGIHMQRIIELYCGPIINATNIKGYSIDSIPWNVKVYPLKYYGDPEYTERILNVLEFTSAVEMDKQFMQDPKRNQLIIDRIKWLLTINKQIFVFVGICEYAEILSKMLDNESYIMMGKYKLGNPDARVIFTTFKYCSKGISIPRMNAIILTQPRKSDIEQVVGRILRIGGNIEEERIIIDIIDMNTTLKNQYTERKKIYTKQGFQIEK